MGSVKWYYDGSFWIDGAFIQRVNKYIHRREYHLVYHTKHSGLFKSQIIIQILKRLVYYYEFCWCVLTHWGRNHIDAISHTTFSNEFFFNENIWILIKISLKFVPKGPINNIPALVQIMAWRRPGDKPLSEPMMLISLTHICVTRPQWVKPLKPMIIFACSNSSGYFKDILIFVIQNSFH